MTTTAEFTINGSATPPELAVSGGTVVTLALTSVSGVRTVVWSIVGNSSSSLTNPTITPGGSPLGSTATFTMPVGTDQGYRVHCQVNGGKDDEGVVQSSLTKTAIVGVVNTAGVVPFCSGETYERNAIYGYTMALNAIGDSVGGGTGSLADGSVTFPKIQAIGVGLMGNDTGAASPKLITLGSGLAFAAGALAVSALALSGLANIAAHTFLGNNTGSSAAPSALTATQLTAELNAATTTLKGLVPAPGTATGKYLKDDLTWATPSGTFTNPVSGTDDGKLGYASSGAIAWASAIKTNGTYLAFGGVDPTVLTIGANRYAHATHITAGLGSDGTTNYDLVQWGVGTNNKLQLGSSGVAVTELQGKQLKVTASAQATSALTPTIALTGGAHTTLTASTEVIDVLVDLGQTKQWATGSLATQRGSRVVAPTYAFVGASTLALAATLAISGAPAAGTNATITNSLALWVEAGAIGYGAAPAQSGATRYSTNTFAKWRNGAGTPNTLDLNGIGFDATDSLVVGDNTNGVALYLDAKAGGITRIRSGAQVWAFNDVQLDCGSKGLANVLSLNGTRVTIGVLGTALPDANGTTISVAGGTVYEQTTAFTANRSVAIAITGATTKEVVTVKRHVTDGFTLTVTDEVGNPLYTFPAGEKRTGEFQFNTSVANKFACIGHQRIA